MTESDNSRRAKLRQSLRKSGSKLPQDIRRLAKAVFDETDDDLSHQDCLATLPAYIETEMEGARIASQFPKVKQHLDTCAECAEEYAQLLEITLAERAGQISAVSIPIPDLTFLPLTLAEFAKQKAAKILAAFAPAQQQDLETIAEVFFERLNSLGGKFILQPQSVQALGLGATGENQVLAILAVTYAATEAIVDTLTAAQIASLDQNQLRARIEEQANTAAKAIQVEPKLAKKITAQYAQQTSADLATLRALIEQQKG